MAKVSISLFDDDTEEDAIRFRVEFDPPLKEDDIITPAQSEAAFLLEVMQRRASGQTLTEIAAELDDDKYGRVAGGFEPSGLTLVDDEGTDIEVPLDQISEDKEGDN